MNPYMTVWYKSPLIKGLFVLLGVIVMILVARLVLQFTWLWLFLGVVFGYAYWTWSKALLRIRYHFEKESIRIVMPSRKEVTLAKEDIIEMSMVDVTMPFWRSVWVFSDEMYDYCITSSGQLVQIRTAQKSLLISPRRIEDGLLSYYTS